MTRTRSNHPWKSATYTDFVYVCRSDTLSLSLNGGHRTRTSPRATALNPSLLSSLLQKEPLRLLRSSDLAHCNLSYGPQEGRSKCYSTTLQHPPPARAFDALVNSLSLVQLSRARSYLSLSGVLAPNANPRSAPFSSRRMAVEFALLIALRARPPLDEARALSARPSLLTSP